MTLQANLCRQNEEIAEAIEESKATCSCIRSCYLWEQMIDNRVCGVECKTRNMEWNGMWNGTWNRCKYNIISPRQGLIGVGINWGEH